MGGDAQLGTLIAEGRIDGGVLLWDRSPRSRTRRRWKALLRLAVLYECPSPCNRSSATHHQLAAVHQAGEVPVAEGELRPWAK